MAPHFFGFIAPLIPTMGAYIITENTGEDLLVFVRDWSAISNLPNYYSGLEVAGYLVLACAASISVFCGFVSKSPWKSFLLMSGILSLALCIDDAYVLHEHAWVVKLTEKKVFFGYFLWILMTLILSWKLLPKTPIGVLLVSLLLLMFSATIDSFEIPERFLSLVPSASEDLLEFFAFSLWSVYWINTSWIAIRLNSDIEFGNE